MYTKEKIKQNLSWVVKADQEDKVIDKQELNLIWALSEFAETTLQGIDLSYFKVDGTESNLEIFKERVDYLNEKDLEGVPEGLDLIDSFAMGYNLNTRQENKLREIVKDADAAVDYNVTNDTYEAVDDWTIKWEKRR